MLVISDNLAAPAETVDVVCRISFRVPIHEICTSALPVRKSGPTGHGKGVDVVDRRLRAPWSSAWASAIYAWKASNAATSVGLHQLQPAATVSGRHGPFIVMTLDDSRARPAPT